MVSEQGHQVVIHIAHVAVKNEPIMREVVAFHLYHGVVDLLEEPGGCLLADDPVDVREVNGRRNIVLAQGHSRWFYLPILIEVSKGAVVVSEELAMLGQLGQIVKDHMGGTSWGC
jgi:hypothetical protein